MLTPTERDRGLLKILDDDDRRALEEEVDAFIRDRLQDATPFDLKVAAAKFDSRASQLPSERAILARCFAAVFRARAAGMFAS